MTGMTMPGQIKLMQGNEACVEAAIAAGVRFFAGYPITPSSEIAEQLAAKLPRVGGKFIQMEDEIASMAAVIGASLAGVKSMTATSGPGFSLKQENLGYACLTEVPCVVVNVMRGGPSTGLPTSPAQGDVMQARWGTHGDHPIIVLSPATVQEMYHLTISAINFSERFRNPVILLPDEVVAHAREKLVIPDPSQLELFNRVLPTEPPENYLPYRPNPETDVPPMVPYGEGYRFHVTGLIHDETGFPTQDPKVTVALIKRLHQKIEKGRKDLTLYKEYYLDDAEIAIFAYGSTARSALRAVRDAREAGMKVGLLRAITLWPFPDEIVSQMAERARVILVPEMNMGQMVREVERAVHGKAEVVSIPQVSGELFTPKQIMDEMTRLTGWSSEVPVLKNL
jgi:2-oxoglutarate ferredoxin oxidoreductase subunit alpha